MDSVASRSSMRSLVRQTVDDVKGKLGRPTVSLDLTKAIDANTAAEILVTDSPAGGSRSEPVYFLTLAANVTESVPVERFRQVFAARYSDLLREALKLKGADGSEPYKLVARLRAVALSLNIKERKFTNFELLEQQSLKNMETYAAGGQTKLYNQEAKALGKLRKNKSKYAELEQFEDKKITIFKDKKVGKFAVQEIIGDSDIKKVLSKYGAQDEIQIYDSIAKAINRTAYDYADVSGQYFAGKPGPAIADGSPLKPIYDQLRREATTGEPRLYFSDHMVDPVQSASGVMVAERDIVFNPDPQQDIKALAVSLEGKKNLKEADPDAPQ